MTRKIFEGIALAVLLAMSVLTISAFNLKLNGQSVFAQTESITATKVNFFGSNVVEVTVIDDDLEDNEEPDEITVGFDVQSGSDQTSDDFDLAEDAEVGDSGRFVFYITADGNLDEDAIPPTALLEDPEHGNLSEVITITEDGDIDIGTDAGNDALDGDDDDGISLNEGATITITYGDASLNITYQDDKADVILDRTNVGSEGFIYLKIDDQDANNDPTGRDELDFTGTAGDALSVTGTDDPELGEILAGEDFKETGDNTGIFEVRLSIEDTLGLDATDTPVSVTIELEDFEIFPNDPFSDDEGAAGIDGEDDSKESIVVDNSDGIIEEVTNPASPRSELKVVINDPDRNLDSKVKDRIADAIAADLSSGSTDDSEAINDVAANIIDLVETGINTGKFVPDTAGNLIEVTIQDAVVNNGIVEIDNDESARSDLLVRYGDMTPDDADDLDTDLDDDGGDINDAKTILFKGKAAANTPAVISLGQKQIGPQDKVFLVVTDQDLNDDKDSVDSFGLEIGAGTFDDGILTVDLVMFNEINIADLELESIINGDEATDDFPEDDITLSFQETGKDTGIFAAEFEYEFLASGGNTDDGDNTEFTWDDQLLDAPLESSVRLTINQPDVGVSWQQNEYAVPFIQEDRGTFEVDGDVDAKRTRVKLFVNDPALNQDSSTVEQWEFSIIDDAGDVDAEEAVPDATPDAGSIDSPDLTVKLVGADGDVLLDAEAGEITACSGMSQFQTFTETGANTGIFDRTFDFNVAGGACNIDPDELANARLVADYEDSTRSTVLKANSGILKTSSKTISSGQEITITVTDPDQNHDRDVREQVEITFEPDGLAETEELLEETDLNTGIFTKKFVVGEDFEILDDGELVDDVTVRYIDAVTADGSTGEERELILSPPSSNGELTINPTSGIGPNTKIRITLVDIDLNEDPNTEDAVDTDVLEIKSDNDNIEPSKISLGEDGLQLEETDNTSGVFELILNLVPITPQTEDPEMIVTGSDELDIAAEPGDIISISYEDENHDDNGKDVVNVIIHVESFDPEFSTDKPFYVPGDTMTVSIIDSDANTDPDVTDVIEDVNVYTDKDAVGESFEAVETGANTGVFTFQVFIVEGTFEADSVTAEEGDTMIIEYNDQFPADYAGKIEDVDDPDKDFTFEVPVGEPRGESTPDTTSPSAPTLKDVTGDDVNEVTIGQQVVLSTTITNNIDNEQPFVALIEVRNSDGITIYLAWQTGTLNPEGKAEVGLSWTPEEGGEYTVRTFVISDLANPHILSELQESEFTVS